ncbi:MAG: Hpt domain-containing protein [Acidobacteriota bacterium]
MMRVVTAEERRERRNLLSLFFLCKAREDLSLAVRDLDRGHQQTAVGVAHQLKGAGTTLGFPEVTARASRVLRQLDEPSKARARDSLANLQRVVELRLNDLDDTVQEEVN